MSTRALSLLLAVLFALTVIARLPTSWALAALPAGMACELPTGSIWRGACGQLHAGGLALDGVRWQVHVWPLLRAHLDADVVSADPRAAGTAFVSMAPGGRVTVRDLTADVPVDSGLLPMVPTGWSGRLRLAFTRLELDGGRLHALEGTATAQDLARNRPALAVGSYELRFDPASGADAGPEAIRGELRDLGGPLLVSGRVSIRNGSDYEISGLVAARPEASPELAKGVEFLGAADPQGRRPFSMAGTF